MRKHLSKVRQGLHRSTEEEHPPGTSVEPKLRTRILRSLLLMERHLELKVVRFCGLAE